MTSQWRHHDVATEGHLCPSSPLTRDGHIYLSSPVRVMNVFFCVFFVPIKSNRLEILLSDSHIFCLPSAPSRPPTPDPTKYWLSSKRAGVSVHLVYIQRILIWALSHKFNHNWWQLDCGFVCGWHWWAGLLSCPKVCQISLLCMLNYWSTPKLWSLESLIWIRLA